MNEESQLPEGVWYTTVWWIQSRQVISDLMEFPLTEKASFSFLGIGKSPGKSVIVRLRNEELSCCCAVCAALWPCIASGCSFPAHPGAAALTVSYASFEGKCIWSLLCAVQCSGPVSSSWDKSSSDSFKTSKSLDTAELLQLNCTVPRRAALAARERGLCGVGRAGEGAGAWALAEESSRASAGVTGTKWQLWNKTTQSIDIDNKRIVAESVNSFRIWLYGSSKWKQTLIGSCTVGAEGNEWTFAASVLRSHTELAAAFGQLSFDFITNVRRLCLDWCFGS